MAQYYFTLEGSSDQVELEELPDDAAAMAMCELTASELGFRNPQKIVVLAHRKTGEIIHRSREHGGVIQPSSTRVGSDP